LLADLLGRGPEQAFAGQDPAQLGDRGDLAPDQGEHGGDHHRQAQAAVAQALLAGDRAGGDNRVLEQVSEPGFDLRHGGGGTGAGPGMIPVEDHGAGLGTAGHRETSLATSCGAVQHATPTVA
jgi:hypothetical protein